MGDESPHRSPPTTGTPLAVYRYFRYHRLRNGFSFVCTDHYSPNIFGRDAYRYLHINK